LSVARESVASPPAADGKASFRQILANPKMLVIMVMAAASGYPNQLTESALQAWLKDSHASNTVIGWMSYVSLPYLLKFLWAPFVDRYPIPILGRRRGWILLTQLLLAAAIALLAVQNPAVSLTPIAICAAVIVFLSATQDIGIDAYRSDVSLPPERGLAATATNLGYRTAAWFASAVALIIADYFGWRPAFLILAAVRSPPLSNSRRAH
jgi:PAT family beta-lactamase induction signal transducer AmpG